MQTRWQARVHESITDGGQSWQATKQRHIHAPDGAAHNTRQGNTSSMADRMVRVQLATSSGSTSPKASSYKSPQGRSWGGSLPRATTKCRTRSGHSIMAIAWRSTAHTQRANPTGLQHVKRADIIGLPKCTARGGSGVRGAVGKCERA